MDQRGVFVDRPVAISLFELLFRNDQARTEPLPILVLYGAGGSGRTRLLDYLYSRAKDPLTCARVRVGGASGPNTLSKLLDSVYDELASDRHPQCGLIPFPRYELGQWMRKVAPELGAHPDLENIRKRLRELLNRRFRVPGDASRENIFVAGAHFLVNLLLPHVLTQPSVFRRILWGRSSNTGFVWYERGQRTIELPEGRHITDVIRRICALVNSGDPEDAAVVDELLVSAFLEDLRAAYDPDAMSRAELRTTCCVALVDDIDRLPDGQGFRLLELLARERASGTPDPLLLVVTSQQRWTHAGGVTGGVTGEDPAAGAVELLASWQDALQRSRNQQSYPIANLFVRLGLPRLSREQSRRLVLSPRPRPQPDSQEVLAEEIFQVTHGHPLAVQLVTQALAGRRPGVPRLSIRGLMEEPLPSGVSDRFAGESVGDYLLRRFVEPVTERLDVETLAACAAPRALDLPTLRVALDLPDDDSGRLYVAEVWDELARYAFTEVAGDGRLVLHPLLRDLLIRELSATAEPSGPLSYVKIHTRLVEHFGAAAEERPEAVVDRLYHELALGRVQSVLRTLGDRATPDHPDWRSELLAVARAPSRPHFSRHNLLAELRERMHALRSRRGENPLGIALDQARVLYSPTSDTPWTVELLEGLAEALSEVNDGEHTAVGYVRADRSARLVRPLEPPGDATPPDGGGRPLVRTDEDIPFPAPRRTSHRRLWQAAAVLALAAPLLVYLAVYRSYAVETCDPVGPLNVWGVVADRVGDDGLHVRHTGPGGAGPCVGITDGDDYVYGTTTTGRVQADIARQNERVLELNAETGRQYVTAVVMTTLTAPDAESSKQVAAGRNELEGIYLAQQHYNTDAPVPMLRVLVANVGYRGEHAAQVARQVVRAAEHDPTIIAALGLGEGTGKTLQATRILGAAGLPVVASTTSGDAFSNVSDHFFRVAATNRRQAALAAAYAKEELDARTALVIGDSADTYSHSLATDFADEFADQGHTMIWPERLSYDASQPDVTNQLSELVKRACVLDPELIYYAGRADHMDTVLNTMVDASCDSSVAIMGGHDLSLLSVPPFPVPLPEVRNPLYYTTMAAPDAWRVGRTPRFFGAYRSYLANGDPSATQRGATWSDRAALAYDATTVLTNALIRVPGAEEVDRFTVWRRIGLTTGTNQVPGAGGVIDFGSEPNGDPVDKAVMLVRLQTYGEPRWIGTCGQLGVDPGAATTPQQQIPCPNTG